MIRLSWTFVGIAWLLATMSRLDDDTISGLTIFAIAFYSLAIMACRKWVISVHKRFIRDGAISDLRVFWEWSYHCIGSAKWEYFDIQYAALQRRKKRMFSDGN